MGTALSKLNPITDFVFFMGVIVLGMLFRHPFFTAISLIFGILCALLLKKEKCLKFLFGMVLLFLIISVFNMIFSTNGATELFVIFGKKFTFEALAYGMEMAGIVINVLVWFYCYNSVADVDGILYIFSGIMPRTALIISMILGELSKIRKKYSEIAESAKMFEASDPENKRAGVRRTFKNLSALTTWALESGIITANSMKNRGYGCGKRRSFRIFRFTITDGVIVALTVILIALLCICAANGAARYSFYPEISLSGFDEPSLVYGMIIYALLLLLPMVLSAVSYKSLQSAK